MNELPEPATASEEPPASEAADEEERPSLGKSVGQAAGLLGSERLSNGDRAALRRISPEAPFTPALWKVLYRLEQHEAPGWFGSGTREERQRMWERRWATLLMGMAFCARPQEADRRKRHLHDYETPLGAALFDAGGSETRAGWSELRFVRLLRSSGEALEVEIRRVAQYLASKSQPANWADMARLLFNQPNDLSLTARDIAEKCRLSIARAYYGARYKSEQQGE